MDATATNPHITIALKELRERQPIIARWQRYYDGDHDLTVDLERWREVFGPEVDVPVDNLCPLIVEAVVDKLQVAGWRERGTPDDADPRTPAVELVESIWEWNRFDQRLPHLVRRGCRDGGTALLVWPNDAGIPVLYPQRADSTYIHYDAEDPGKILWAAKTWITDDRHQRVNIYYPDLVEKWVSNNPVVAAGYVDASAFRPYLGDGDGGQVPNPWHRVPVFPYANDADIGEDGTAEFDSAIPLQDALNKDLADMMAAGEYAAFPQRWAIGLEARYDDDGNPIPPFKPGVDRVWAISANKNEAAFGQFESADLTKFLEVQDSYRRAIARNTRTSTRTMGVETGIPPSGEALRVEKENETSKVRARQRAFGSMLEDALAFAVKVQTGQDVAIEVLWRDPEPSSELEQVQAAEGKRRIGVPLRYILTDLGFPASEVDHVLAEVSAEKEEAAARQRRAFAMGDPDTGDS